jgi:hypothetical protein
MGVLMDTVTAFSGVTLALCGCCVEHGPDPVAGGMTWKLVTCPECGGLCSCEGCVVEAAEMSRKEKD